MIQSVTLDARRPPSTSSLAELRDLGITHITLVQFGFQPDIAVPEIRMRTSGNWYTESDQGIRALSRQADSLGIGVILKPHLWVGRYTFEDQSRSDIEFGGEQEWLAWQTQYRAFVMHYAHLAQEVDAAMLVIGTELTNAARRRAPFWRSLIEEIRTAYDGHLTYAANWWEEYEHITFWDRLDYIGIQAYFELSSQSDPTAAMLHGGWASYKTTMRRLSEKAARPVLFTEIGYRNVPDVAAQPWRWPSRDEIGAVAPDDALQVRLYQVFFESLWSEPWFAGAILWKWKPDEGRRRNYLDFSPQNKLAEQVIGDWFNAQRRK